MKNILLNILLACVVLSACKKDDLPAASSKVLYAKKGNDAGIYDAEGRYRILRGVNYNVLGDYWQANANIPTTKNYAAEDIRMMSQYGFNCIRLLFSWSLLEPQKGVYNQAYINQIKAVVQEAANYDMYVMLDMHQDAWGKYIATPQDSVCIFPNKGWDGAPQWATITNGASTCSPDGRREAAPAVYYAFQNFWDNTIGMQDACIAAWQQLVTATASYENVLGYDLFNEPSLGYKEPKDNEMAKLSSFYGKLTQAIRSAESASGKQHTIFFEPAIQWKGLEELALNDANFTADENIVFAPHSYFEAIGNTSFSIEQGFGILQFGSQTLYKTALFIGEWGFFGNPASDVEKVKRFAAVEDKNFVSSTWWQWAQSPGDPHGISWDGNTYDPTSMHLIELNQSASFTGNVNTVYLKVLGRARPNAIVGKPTLLTSNADNGAMHLEATAAAEGITELWIPDYFGTPKISGNNVSLKELKTVAGGYKAFVKVLAGNYTIDVNY